MAILVEAGPPRTEALLSELEARGIACQRLEVDALSGDGPDAPASLATALSAVEAALEPARSDAAILAGDGDAVLAAALVAAKRELPFARIGAGERDEAPIPTASSASLVDRLASMRICADQRAAAVLAREGIEVGCRVEADPAPAADALAGWLRSATGGPRTGEA